MNFAGHIIAELSQPELCAQLRIIAADEKKLSVGDRGVLLTAAAEIELAYRQLLVNNASICELAAHQMALVDRINALTPKSAWSASASLSVKWP